MVNITYYKVVVGYLIAESGLKGNKIALDQPSNAPLLIIPPLVVFVWLSSPKRLCEEVWSLALLISSRFLAVATSG